MDSNRACNLSSGWSGWERNDARLSSASLTASSKSDGSFSASIEVLYIELLDSKDDESGGDDITI
jgi:hypothetical protein